MDVMVDGDYIVTARLANGEFELPLHNQHLNSQVLSNTLSLGTTIYNRDATIAEKINGKDIVVSVKSKCVDMTKVG